MSQTFKEWYQEQMNNLDLFAEKNGVHIYICHGNVTTTNRCEHPNCVDDDERLLSGLTDQEYVLIKGLAERNKGHFRAP